MVASGLLVIIVRKESKPLQVNRVQVKSSNNPKFFQVVVSKIVKKRGLLLGRGVGQPELGQEPTRDIMTRLASVACEATNSMRWYMFCGPD